MLAGDRFLVDEAIYPNSAIFAAGESWRTYQKVPGKPTYCQRIIGLPGDVIEIRNEVALLQWR